jgi:SAM-dependent methyltransferase
MIKTFLKKTCSVTGIPHYFLKNNLTEIRMIIIRMYANFIFQKIKIKKILKQSYIKLNFGCGATRYPEWINIDSFFSKNVDILLDLRRKLPFTSNTVAYCYSEHFLEHLYPDEAMLHLREVCRVLKKGGIYRVVVPAGIRFVERYLSGDEQFFKLAFPWEGRPMDAIYNILNWGGEHKNIFDFAQLEYMAKKAGFLEARECHANSSPTAVLRIDISDPQRVAESLYVEFIKSAD